TLASNGSIVITVDGAIFTVSDAISAHGGGDVLLHASAGDLVLAAAVRSAEGHLAIRAQNDLALAASASVQTGAPGTVFLEAASGAISMNGASTVAATNSNLRIAGGGDVALSHL